MDRPHLRPEGGGSYVRDKDTGELIPQRSTTPRTPEDWARDREERKAAEAALRRSREEDTTASTEPAAPEPPADVSDGESD